MRGENKMKTLGLILFVIALLFLQIYLSRKESKGLGWILPSAVFLYSLDRIYVLILHISSRDPEYVVMSEVIRFSLTVFIITNMLTVSLLLINFHFKKKRRAMKELEKMNIQDLH